MSVNVRFRVEETSKTNKTNETIGDGEAKTKEEKSEKSYGRFSYFHDPGILLKNFTETSDQPKRKTNK